MLLELLRFHAQFWNGENKRCQSPGFKPPPSSLELSLNKVHIWSARLDVPKDILGQLEKTLCPDELKRAQKFIFKKHSRRFTAARGFLRSILGGYLDIEPAHVKFSYTDEGKPELESEDNANISFNLAHSNEMAIYAITAGRSVGIDLEYMRDKVDLDSIARQFFSTTEAKTIISLPSNQKLKEFYNIWTLKEAYLKATGIGLAGLGRVEACVPLTDTGTFFHVHDDPQESTRWFVYQFKPSAGYIATVVVRTGTSSNTKSRDESLPLSQKGPGGFLNDHSTSDKT